MGRARKYKRKRKPFAMPFRDAAGNVGVTVPSNMTVEDMVRLGLEPRMVHKDEALGPNTYRYDYERDMPEKEKGLPPA